MQAKGDEILAELKQFEWFGLDPIKTRDALELGKYLEPSKFRTPLDYLDALLKAVDRLEAIRNARS